jgi:hypothetical protein
MFLGCVRLSRPSIPFASLRISDFDFPPSFIIPYIHACDFAGMQERSLRPRGVARGIYAYARCPKASGSCLRVALRKKEIPYNEGQVEDDIGIRSGYKIL